MNAIVLVVNALSAGGAERVTLDLFKHLLKRNISVYLFVSYWGSENERIYKIDNLPNVCKGSSSKNKVIRAFYNIHKLNDLLSKINPSWVVSLGSSYGLLEACKCFEKTKVLLSERNWPPEFYDKQAFRKVCVSYQKADAIVFQTQAARDCFSDEIRNKGIVIPNPAPVGLPHWKGKDSKRVIYFGRLDPQKNPKMALEAFAIFCKRHPDYRLDFYGVGSERTMLMTRIDELGLANNVFLNDAIENIHEVVSDSLMYLNTSYYEGISNAMLEALAMGVPCICTDCGGGGAALSIKNEVSGMLIQCNDILSMAEAMERISEDKEFAISLSHGAQSSMSRFAPDVVFDSWANILTF